VKFPLSRLWTLKWPYLCQKLLCHIILSYTMYMYPTCIDQSDKHNNLPKKYVQTLPKSRKVSSKNSFNRIRTHGCFYEKYVKMHERNIARPRMPICRVIKISDHTKCWSGDLRSWAFKAGENQLVRSVDSDQTLVRFSYYIEYTWIGGKLLQHTIT
jgi:hypothetical protein